MNKCNNPECNKEIPESKKYCDEGCIKKHLALKGHQTDEPKKNVNFPPIANNDTIFEIKEIMDFFGRFHTEGFIRGQHITSILSYLHMQKTEDYLKTKRKLTMLMGMGQRYIQENYLDGLEDWGIIEMFMSNNNVRHWKWKGIKALRNDGEQ